jgi:hypothetical protein
MTQDPGNLLTSATFSDADSRRAVHRALRMVGIAAALGALLLWWKLGWPSAALFVVGALISGSGLFEWLRLMTALMARMEHAESAPGAEPARVRPLAPVLLGFFLRLFAALALLYVSLKYLHGSVLALLGGLSLGVVALSIEALRLLRNWTR